MCIRDRIAAPGGRVVAEVSPEFRKEKGVGIVTYGIAPNEVIEFPDTEADIKPFTRTVRPNSAAVAVSYTHLDVYKRQ